MLGATLQQQLDRFTVLTLAYVDVYLHLAQCDAKPGRTDLHQQAHDAVRDAAELVELQRRADVCGQQP